MSDHQHDAPTLWLIRHGETEWSRSGQHTGRTNLPLTEAGRAQAAKLAAMLEGVRFTAVVTSPRRRARETAELSAVLRGDLVARVDEDLAEWDYGAYEGLTSVQIKAQRPSWSLWTDGAPEGESPEQVCAPADRLLARLGGLRGDVALFGHGHILRVVALRHLGWALPMGAQLGLDTATIGRLGYAVGRPALIAWNCASGS